MERPNYFGIRYLSDLLDVEKIKKLNDELLRIYDEILMGDITVSCQELNSRDQLLFTKGHNPAYWEQVLPNPDDFTSGSSSRDYLIARKKYERKLARFKFLLINTGASSHKEIVRSLMIEKSAKLLRCPSEKKTHIFKSTQKRGKLTKVLSDVNPNKFLKTDKKTGETDLPGLKKNQQLKRKSGNVKTGEIDSLLYSVVSPHNGGEIKRICKVTKLDITMQKENSEFLCTTGIKYYKKNYPGIWLKLWQRLDTKWHGCSEETQIQEIHHSIRNQYFNKIHNTRRSIDRIVNEPALFSQLDLIRKDKLELAGLAS